MTESNDFLSELRARLVARQMKPEKGTKAYVAKAILENVREVKAVLILDDEINVLTEVYDPPKIKRPRLRKFFMWMAGIKDTDLKKPFYGRIRIVLVISSDSKIEHKQLFECVVERVLYCTLPASVCYRLSAIPETEFFMKI